MTAATLHPLKVFISYSHDDDGMRQALIKHLSQLRREGLIEDWNDRLIAAGREWEGSIDANLEAADIILLLVSADFLDSEYCQDREMTRALQRHHAGQARVIPIILRPCDWQTSRFAKLHALPRDGRPIIEWQPPDAGYLDAARGLRRVVSEIRGSSLPQRRAVPGEQEPPAEEPTIPAPPRARPSLWKLAIVAVVAVGLLASWWFYRRSAQAQALIDEGSAFMTTGLYAEAAKSFGEAAKLKARSTAAVLGARKASLGEKLQSVKPNFDALDVELDALLKQAPQDADLIMFDGDRHYRRQDLDGAEKRCTKALELNPKLAEAHYRLGVLSEERGQPDAARKHYSEALALSPETAHYGGNLAYTWLKERNFDKAIDEYGKLDRYILGALEGAHALWGKQRFEEAQELQLEALAWIEDKEIRERRSNQLPWVLLEDENVGVRLPSDSEKHCYAQLSLAATSYLLGREAEAQKKVDTASCPELSGHIRRVLSFDLRTYVEPYSSDDVAVRSRGFRDRYLGSRRQVVAVLLRRLAMLPSAEPQAGELA